MFAPGFEPSTTTKQRLRHRKGDTSGAEVTIIGNDSSSVAESTHGILYEARRLHRKSNGTLVEIDPTIRKIGYTKIRSHLFSQFQGNDVWRAMVAERLETYNTATGGNFYWEVVKIIIVPRGVVGTNIQIDKDVQNKLWNKLGTEFGNNQDLIDLDFRNQIDDIKNSPEKITQLLHDSILKLFNQKPNSIELDCAQAIQVACVAHDMEEYYKEHGSLVGFKGFCFDAPRAGKTLLTLCLALETFVRKYGFTRIVILNWVLTANTSYRKEIYNWAELSSDTINLVNPKNPEYSNTKINIDICSAHGSLDSFTKRYSHMKDYDGKTLMIQDEFDEGLTCKNQIQKAEWVNADSIIACTGSGLEKAMSVYQYDSVTSISFSEPMMFNNGTHPFQKDWYEFMPKHITDVIDAYRNNTPAWSEKRVKWNVGDLILDPQTVEQYSLIADVFDKSVLLTMSKFLHSIDNYGMLKDFYSRMLVGSQKTIGASVLNCGIELSAFMGYQPWTVLIDLEAINNKEFDTHVKEFNKWAMSEIKAIGIAVNGDDTDYTSVLEQLYDIGIDIDIPAKFTNSTAEEKMNKVCNELHRLGYKVIFFSKGMGFKSNSCEYIEVVVHMRDGGSVDVRYQAGARSTTPGKRFNGSVYVQKTDGFDIYVTLNSKTHANLMKQTINGMCQDLIESTNRQKPTNVPEMDEREFYKTIGVLSNEGGKVKSLNVEEAYRYANTPEVLQAVMGSQAMLVYDKIQNLSPDCIDTLQDMLLKSGNTRFNTRLGGNKTGGKTGGRPKRKIIQSNNPPKNNTDSEQKKQMEALFNLMDKFTKNLKNLFYLAEEQYGIEISIDNLDVYDILIKLNDDEELVFAFGAEGEKMVKLFKELNSIGITMLKSVSLNHIAIRQLEEIV